MSPSSVAASYDRLVDPVERLFLAGLQFLIVLRHPAPKAGALVSKEEPLQPVAKSAGATSLWDTVLLVPKAVLLVLAWLVLLAPVSLFLIAYGAIMWIGEREGWARMGGLYRHDD